MILDPVKKSLWSLHFTMVLLGGTALFAKVIPLSATDITFGRSLFACISLFLFVKLSGNNWRLRNGRDQLVAVLLGIIMAAHWITYFAAMQYSSVSVGMIALFTFPVITVLLEPFFERITLVWQDIASALVVLLGIYLIVPDVSFNNDISIGVALGIFSAFLYAIRNLVHRKHFSHYSGATAMAYQTLIICLCLLFFTSDELATPDVNNWLLLALLGTVFTALPHALIAASLKHLRAKTFSLVACMQPLYGVILAMLVLNEHPRWQTLAGGILVISAALYETINAQKLHRKGR